MERKDLLEKMDLVANGLGELLEKTVFIGAAMCPFYIKSPLSDELRPTTDIDAMMDAKNVTEMNLLETSLRAKGFTHDTAKDAPRCRWIYKGIQVDIVPIAPIGGYENNRWYKEGANHAQRIDLPSGKTIQILSLPFFIATKLEAFKSRGKINDRDGSDLEDIILLVEANSEFESELHSAPQALAQYIKAGFSLLLRKKDFPDFIDNCLGGSLREARQKKLLGRLKALTELK